MNRIGSEYNQYNDIDIAEDGIYEKLYMANNYVLNRKKFLYYYKLTKSNITRKKSTIIPIHRNEI